MSKSRVFVIGLCLNLILSISAISPPGGEAFEKAAMSNVFSGAELIEAPHDATVFVSLNGIGQAVLSSGARVRMATITKKLGNGASQPMLIAQVIDGDLLVKLHPRAGAFVEASGSDFIASQGAVFHTSVKDGYAMFDASERVSEKIGNWAIRLPRDMFGAENLVESKPVSVTPLKQPEALRLNLKTSIRPIGSVNSIEAFSVNSRPSSNLELLWGNELIKAPAGANAQASLNGLGQVTLTGGSQARLTATTVSIDPQRPVLAASMLNGGMIVKLLPGVSACVRANNSTFVAARGSRFRVMLVEGRAVIDSGHSEVLEIGDWKIAESITSSKDFKRLAGQVNPQSTQRQYVIRPVGLNSNLVVRARSTRQIQVRVTDENDRPIPDVPVIFLLSSSGGKSIGTIGSAVSASSSAKVFADAQGIATVNFTAGDEAATGSISATVEGTNATWVGQISLLKVVTGFWAPQNAIPVLATAAAAVTVGVVKGATREDKLPIKVSGPTIIKP